MKVDKPGLKQWWDGLPLECMNPECGCAFHLESGDGDTLQPDPGTVAKLRTRCPNCFRWVSVRKPFVQPSTEKGVS